MPELILAIDVGTTSTRAAVFEPDGRIAGLAAGPLSSRQPGPGLVEQDAVKVWRATRKAIAGALACSGRSALDIAAVGLTTQRASAVVWDRATGEPLAPMVIWSDLRGAARAGELAQAGFLLSPQQSATKLEAILAAIDAPPGHVAFGNIDSYVLFRLTGGAVHATDRSQAWPSGYLALPDLTWNQRLLDHQHIDGDILPGLVDTWGDIGITAASAIGAAAPITAVIADQQSALIAHGEAPGTAKLTWGTSGVFDLHSGGTFLFPGPTTPPLLVSSAAGETNWCVEGMVLSAGSALDWLRSAVGFGDAARFDALAASVADCGGAAFLPALQGLGAPHGDPTRRAALTGLSPSVGRGHIARAGLEGLAFRAREVIEHIYSLTDFEPPDVLGLDGGLTASPLFLQILADLLNQPVRRHAVAEATLLGAALAAGRGARLLSETDIAAARRFEAPVVPAIGAGEAQDRFAAWRAAVYG